MYIIMYMWLYVYDRAALHAYVLLVQDIQLKEWDTWQKVMQKSRICINTIKNPEVHYHVYTNEAVCVSTQTVFIRIVRS